MSNWLLFALLGTGTGALYGALALGIVLVYRGSGVVNFAQVALATYPAFIYTDLRSSGTLMLPLPVWHEGVHLSWSNSVHLADSMSFWPAFAIALAVAALIGFLIDLLVFRPLADAPAVTKIVASLGVNAVLIGLIRLQWGPQRAQATRKADQILPHGNIHLLGIIADYNRFVLAGVAVIAALGLWALYRWTFFGLSTAAASQSLKGVELLGISPARISSLNWILGSMLVAAFGVFAAPIQGVSLGTYDKYLAFALAAAMAARLKSFPIAVFTGIGLGMFGSLAVLIKSESWLPTSLRGGFESALPFIVIALVLLLGGTSLPGRGSIHENASPPSPMPRLNPFLIVPAIGAAIAIVAFGTSDLRLALTETLIVSVLALSFVMLAGFVGQVSLATLTFAGVAAYTLARLADRSGIPFPWSPLLAIAFATAVGTLVNFPAVRMRGVQLAVLSYTGAVALSEVLFRNPQLAGMGGTVRAPAPSLFGWEFGPASGPKRTAGVFPYRPFCYFVLAVTVAVALLVTNIRRSSTGRRMLAARGNEAAAAAAGLRVPRTKLLGAGLGCFVASCAGVLWAYKYIEFNERSFAPTDVLAFIALAYIGGITMVSGAFIAGFFTSAGVFYAMINHGKPPLWYGVAYGIALVVVTIRLPGGLASLAPRARRLILNYDSPRSSVPSTSPRSASRSASNPKR